MWKCSKEATTVVSKGCVFFFSSLQTLLLMSCICNPQKLGMYKLVKPFWKRCNWDLLALRRTHETKKLRFLKKKPTLLSTDQTLFLGRSEITYKFNQTLVFLILAVNIIPGSLWGDLNVTLKGNSVINYLYFLPWVTNSCRKLAPASTRQKPMA